MMPPTIKNLEFLARARDAAVGDGRSEANSATPPAILPKLRRDADGPDPWDLRCPTTTTTPTWTDQHASSAAAASVSMRAEQPAMFTGGATSSMILRAIARNSSAAAPDAIDRDRPARVAAGRDSGLERHPTEQFDADLVGQRLAAARAEQCVLIAVLARERRHVLDHAAHPQEAAPGHVGGPWPPPSGQRSPEW